MEDFGNKLEDEYYGLDRFMERFDKFFIKMESNSEDEKKEFKK